MKRTALLMLAVVLGVAAAWAAVRYVNAVLQPPLPVLGAVPAFALIGAQGEAVTQAAFAGHIWIADFIFTTCPGICPILSSQMAKLARATAAAGDVRLASFSVDPANDTPAALQAYAARYEADPQRWLFLTGQRDVLHDLIRDGFHLAVAERSPDEAKGGELITHSDRFVLVDRQLQIRAYYHGTEPEAVAQVLRDIERLREE